MRLFLLPHKDQRQMYFCVNLDPPIKQGQTRYHYLVFSFMQDEETELELPFTDEELQEKYEGKLEKEMKGPTFEIVSKLMKAMVNKKITVPRSGGSNRSFDIEINTRGEATYTFSSIEKDEYHRLFEYLKSKKIVVKSTGKMDKSNLDLRAGANIDHFAETVKADAGSSASDNPMSSDDEDFNPDKLEAKDVKEEYDSDPSDTGSDTDDGAGSGSGSEGEKQKRREEKAKRKAEKAARKKSSAPSERSGKTKKKTKLPGQPKKPMTAYFLWMQEEGRESIKEEKPDIGITEIAKAGGEKWRNLDEDTKKKYEDKHKELKDKYDEEYKEWYESGGKEAMKEAKKAAKDGGSKPSKSPKKKAAKTEVTGGSGGSYQSKEFIEDNDSDSD